MEKNKKIIININLLDGLILILKSSIKPIKNINLKMLPQNIYGLIGINGCGKTSILNAIAKFIDHSGDVKIDNVRTSKLERIELAKKVAYMRQNPQINFNYWVGYISNGIFYRASGWRYRPKQC